MEATAALAARQDLADLLTAAASGDEAAFKVFYDRTSAKLFGVVLRLIGQRAVAEEVLQEVYIKVWQNASRYSAEASSPMTWLIAIARNAALDRLRRGRREREARDDGAADVDRQADRSAGDAFERVVDAGAIATALEGLSDIQKQIILLAYYQGYTRDELADRLGMPVATVKSHLRRGLLRMKEGLAR